MKPLQSLRRIFFIRSSALAAALIGGASQAQTAASCTTEVQSQNRLARNKKTVHEFYDLAFNQSKPAEAIARYTGTTYIQHNPEVKDGKQGFIDYFDTMAKRYSRDARGSRMRVEFIRTVAEADLVTVHCRHTFRDWTGESRFAGVDIFRLDAEGKIVEHWDVLQKIGGADISGNGMF